jgi:hypothetical protein
MIDRLKKCKMNQLLPSTSNTICNHAPATWAIAILLTATSFSCTKNGLPGLQTPGGTHGALLEKTVTIAVTPQNVVQDSIATVYLYNTNKTVPEIQQTVYGQNMGIVVTSTSTYDFTYAGDVLTGSTETSNGQNSENGVVESTSNIVSTTVYHASGDQIVSYATLVSVTSTVSGGFSYTTSTNDSTALTYNGNGKLTQWNMYEELPGTTNYLTFSTESFTYDGSNLSSYVDIVYPVSTNPHPGEIDTITAVYDHNSKSTSEGIFTVIPGVSFILNANDISKLTLTTVGYTPGVMTVSYNTTYNSADQPTVSVSTISTNPTTGIAGIDNGVKETTTFTYQ